MVGRASSRIERLKRLIFPANLRRTRTCQLIRITAALCSLS